MPVLQAFGPLAERAAERLPDGIAAVVCEPATAVFALEAAVDRRFDGEPFFASIVLDDPRVVLARRYGAPLGAQARSYDERRSYFEGVMRQDIALNGVAIGAMGLYDGPTIKTMHDFALTAEALLVRSQTERALVERLLGRRRAHVGVFPGLDIDVPVVRPARRGAEIVIWAPHRAAADLAIHVFALEELFTPVTVVCADGSLPWSRASFVGASDGEAALERARIVIDGSDDPATAIALARTGLPLAVSVTSGAGEYLDGAALFEPWHWKSILSAVSVMLAARGPLARYVPDAAGLEATLARARPPRLADEPLVTIFTPTYNRRTLLASCLDRLEKQTYRNVEFLVVNDAGDDVADIVSRHPRARLIDRPVNGGAFAAANTAFDEARGEYITFCMDDDTLNADHTARLVSAMVASGMLVASSNHILRFRERDGAGGFRTTGFFSQAAGDLDRTELLASNPIQVWMVHRSVAAERAGRFFDTDLTVLADYDATLAFATRHDIAHVDHVTAVGVYTDEGTQLSRAKRDRIPVDLETIYARYPVPGRTAIEGMRGQTLHGMRAQHVEGAGFQPAMRLPPRPTPTN